MSATLFLQTRVHTARLHGRGKGDAVHLACPTCGVAYFADPLTGLGAEGHAAEAVARLQLDCPSHDDTLLIDALAPPTARWLETLPRFPLPPSFGSPSPAWAVALLGLVSKPHSYSIADLRAFPMCELTADFTCDDGWGVPRLRWAGVPLANVLREVEVQPEARFVAIGAGEFVTVLPLSSVDAASPLLAYALDGAPLPVDHGGPLRLVAIDARCWQSVKWVDHIVVVQEPPLETAAIFARERARRGR